MATRVLPQRPDPTADAGCCDRPAGRSLSTVAAERSTADLAILAHPIRMQLLDLLTRSEGSVCVCDLEAAVAVKQPTVSHHLRLLRQAGLVQSERVGLYVYYRIDRVAIGALRWRITDRLAAFG